MTDYRIGVCGSRGWRDPVLIGFHLGLVIGAARVPLSDVLVIHGDAEDGADALTQQICETWGYRTERHPVDPNEWHQEGRAAGPHRNARMVNRGAQFWLAFLLPCTRLSCRRQSAGPHFTHGTAGCAGLAREARIPVRWVTSDGKFRDTM